MGDGGRGVAYKFQRTILMYHKIRLKFTATPSRIPSSSKRREEPCRPCSQRSMRADDLGIIRYPQRMVLKRRRSVDGWYSDRTNHGHLLTVAIRYPQWIRRLVRSEAVWFGDGDFSAVTTSHSQPANDSSPEDRPNNWLIYEPRERPPTHTSAIHIAERTANVHACYRHISWKGCYSLERCGNCSRRNLLYKRSYATA